MNCSSMDLKAYTLGEASEEERRQVETHAPACAECREELARLTAARDCLLTLRDEEMPRRIAFVSDKVFEPRWWQRLWNSGPRLGFASAAMLSAALLANALMRPAAVAGPTVSQAELARTETRIQREVNARVEATLTKAVADSEIRQTKRTAAMLESAAKELQVERRMVAASAGSYDMLYKQVLTAYRTNSQLGDGQ